MANKDTKELARAVVSGVLCNDRLLRRIEAEAENQGIEPNEHLASVVWDMAAALEAAEP